MYLLDTNICIAFMNGHPQIIERMKKEGRNCYIPTFVLAELYKGVFCLQKVEKNLLQLNHFLNLVNIVEFDSEAAKAFGQIQGELKKVGRPTGNIDAFIAAVARIRGDVVVTNNVRHFQNIRGLSIEDWLDA